MEIKLREFYKREVYTGFPVTNAMLTEPGQKTLRELIRNIVMIELFLPATIIIHTRLNKLIISAGSWVLKSKEGQYLTVDPGELEKNYEPINN